MTTSKQQDLSASFLRMIQMLDMLKIEAQHFSQMVPSTYPVHRQISLNTKNLTGNIDWFIADCKRIMPSSVTIIENNLTDDRKYKVYAILDKMKYCDDSALDAIEDVLTEATIEVKP